MVKQVFARFLVSKVLIRVALAAISLSGVAHAQTPNKANAAPPHNARAAGSQQGNDYNFLAGGGGN